MALLAYQRLMNCWPASVLALVALVSWNVHAGEHRYVGSAAIRNNPERGFRCNICNICNITPVTIVPLANPHSNTTRVNVLYQLTLVLYRHELHGACTGEGFPNGSARGIDPAAMKQMAEYNLTVAQV